MDTIPTKESLEFMLSQEGPTLEIMLPLVEKQLKDLKLNYKIERWFDDKGKPKYRLVEVGESTEAWLNRFITQHPKMIQLKNEVRLLSSVDYEVLITGETGTGKELIARALHGQKTGKFIAVNCAGLPDQLVESILFGHLDGAFTGASKTRIGLMKAAENGTFFLDEIGELKLDLQAKFLRAIQEKRITKLGSDKSEEINCRIVCATNKDIRKMCQEGTFRLDLYARLSTFELDILPLSKRIDDIETILNSLEGGHAFVEAFDKTESVIRNLDISLNVRSLQQHVKRYKVLGKLP